MKRIICFSNNMKSLLFLTGALINISCYSQQDYNPAIESFESQKALDFYESENSKLSISDSHNRYGKSSLLWEWYGESDFSTSNFKILSLKESPLAYGDHFPASPTLQMSIYNEEAQDEKITISYYKNGNKEVWFDVDLSFTGWRRIWVPFYEMQGNAPLKGAAIDFDNFKISTSSAKGKLFFDDIIFSQYQDDRFQYPDEMVPFIKADTNLGSDHWMPLISNYDNIKKLEPAPISMAIRLDLKKFEKLIDQSLVVDKKYKVYINTLRDLYQNLNIKEKGNTVVGPPLTFKEFEEYYDKNQQGPNNFNDVKDLGRVLKQLSNFHNRANPEEQEEIKAMFLTGTKYFLDQGWQAGSSGGTRHHIGYNVREITEAFFTMRQLLYDNGLLNEVGASLHWLFNLGMLLNDESTFHVNIDYLNTQSYYHLMLIFMFEKQEKQAAMLSAYSKYMSIILAQEKEAGGFKVDGTAWHHNGHYPAYGIGAFNNVPKVINTLARTRFRIKTEGHKNFKKAFLASRIYSQMYNWGFGNGGRHPLEDNGIQNMKQRFLWMANAGDPTGKTKIDKEFAAAYLRLWGNEDIFNSTLFTKMNGIHKEKLSGYYTFPYAATGVYRRNNWAAFIKGYSKYVWASEIYVNENRYGRYPANGTIQLLNENGEKGSGFQQEGWDWNRYPGATVVYLPLKELEPKIPLLMFRSEESFAGIAKLGDNGVFGMILNESKGSNGDGREVNIGFPGKLYAKKSVFSFDGKLVCIGTNISSVDEENLTQTNLFQNYLTDIKTPLYTVSETIKEFPYKTELKQDSKTGVWLTDAYGNGYHVLSNTPVQIQLEKQHSYHNKYSINTGSMNPKGNGVKETEGNYATAWIDHGLAPKNASYQYVIYPFLDEDSQKNFGKIVEKDRSFKIERADSIAHIVLDKKTNTTSYVVFEKEQSLEYGLLETVSEPALVMVKQNSAKALTISAVQPDLNFPMDNKEQFKNYSMPVELKITLKGKWTAYPADYIKSLDNSGVHTIISLECVNGATRTINVNKL
ncbi:chondroitinase family polysaccharide lyase [Flavivirga sp. 57AJ16]|uniref:chondroitinase family polysaccharide lyase n=1 Tax=Flavivirga sp. 57AJ16 TaxID=3025307 RepID=UPI0023666A79|nr:chondroitinase family polysaccharide lyase [Flavivirga sp. 57AJ16]MDD7887842.1 chondroitinase family polysaccharide lyase [Flavivirga sp. 57AJ16]